MIDFEIFSVIDSVFINNHVPLNRDSFGGAIYAHSSLKGSQIIMINNKFKYSYADEGGFFKGGASSVVIDRCIFDSRYAEFDAGAIYIYNSNNIKIINC